MAKGVVEFDLKDGRHVRYARERNGDYGVRITQDGVSRAWLRWTYKPHADEYVEKLALLYTDEDDDTEIDLDEVDNGEWQRSYQRQRDMAEEEQE
jgi:hypothetical protein